MGDYLESLPDPGSITLELAKTQLLVVGGELLRLNNKGTVVLRLPTTAIQDVDYRAGFDPICLFFFAGGGILGAIGYFVSENNILTTLLYVAAFLLIAIGLMGARCHHIVIHSANGVMTIACADQPDEGEGFVNSLRFHLRGRINGPC